MENEIHGADPNITNPDIPQKDQAPVDPSNTSSIGQRVEQGVIDIKEGISDQSSEWEDEQERNIPVNSGISAKGENYLKDPSPEEINSEEKEL
jgi:hypothetical protein